MRRFSFICFAVVMSVFAFFNVWAAAAFFFDLQIGLPYLALWFSLPWLAVEYVLGVDRVTAVLIVFASIPVLGYLYDRFWLGIPRKRVD